MSALHRRNHCKSANHTNISQRPKPIIYDSLDSDDYDVAFGIDLRKWGGQQGWKAILRKESATDGDRELVPHVLTAMLQGLEEKYKDTPDDGESVFAWCTSTSLIQRWLVKRKSWLYLVGLRETHPLRELINDPHVPTEEMLTEIRNFNAPVIAATGKTISHFD